MTITRINKSEYSVQTNVPMSDHTMLSGICHLAGNVLKTAYKPHRIVLTPIRIKLGPVSLDAVSKLAIGESFETK